MKVRVRVRVRLEELLLRQPEDAVVGGDVLVRDRDRVRVRVRGRVG